MTQCPFISQDCTRSCLWHINSQAHSNCFWTYIRANSDDTGTMTPISQTEIASLLRVKSSGMAELAQQALEALRQLLEAESAKNWLEELDTTGFESLPQIPDTNELP